MRISCTRQPNVGPTHVTATPWGIFYSFREKGFGYMTIHGFRHILDVCWLKD